MPPPLGKVADERIEAMKLLLSVTKDVVARKEIEDHIQRVERVLAITKK